jgi:hypothetical protein
MTIAKVAIPYPDFKYADVINPDEFDANNAAFKVKMDEVVDKVNAADTTYVKTKYDAIGWSGLSGSNNWHNYTGTGSFAPLSFKMSAIGLVSLRGLVEGGSSNTKITTLPAGSRPPYTLRFVVATMNGFSRITISTNGDVTLEGTFSNFLFLDGIHFYID